MKINECTLAAFATSHYDAPPDKEGWLWKKGEVNKAFQKRYFVLKGNLLFYFERKTDREPIGVIILEGCTIELAEDDQERFSFKINFHNAGGENQKGSRIYHLGTECQDTMEEWMKLLACSSHDYMKLMVYELQQKLAELDAIDVSSNRTCDYTERLARDSNTATDLSGLNNMTKNGLHNSTSHPEKLTSQTNMHLNENLQNYRSASAATLATKPSGTRKNPFDDMPPFEVSTYEQPKNKNSASPHFNEKSLDVNDSVQNHELLTNINSWGAQHNSYGKKILNDNANWLSKNRILDV